MRPFLLSMGAACALGLGATWAQSPSPGAGTGNLPQIPFGQTYKDFQFPLYQNGQLSATLSAVSARGLTINRAETTDLRIDLYTDGKVTTTITSPKADLYIADRKMRTKNTVKIDRADLTATAQTCDFDLITKKYLLRQNVRVLLKNFDAGMTSKRPTGPAPVAGSPVSAPVPSSIPPPAPADDYTTPINPRPLPSNESPIDFPGASATTNTPPTPSHP